MFPRNPYSVALGYGKGPQRAMLKLGRGLRRGKGPLVTKCLATAGGFAFGDFLTQYMNRDRSQPFQQQYEPKRAVAMFAVGVLSVGPVLFGFNRWMDVHVLPHAAEAPVTQCIKFLLDQIVGCIFWQAAYIAISEPYRLGAQTLLRDTSAKLSELRTEQLAKLQQYQ